MDFVHLEIPWAVLPGQSPEPDGPQAQAAAALDIRATSADTPIPTDYTIMNRDGLGLPTLSASIGISLGSPSSSSSIPSATESSNTAAPSATNSGNTAVPGTTSGSATAPPATGTNTVATGETSSPGSPNASTDSGSSSSGGLSTGAQAGIGVGAALIVLLLATGCFLLFRRNRRKSAPLASKEAADPGFAELGGEPRSEIDGAETKFKPPETQPYWTPVSELDATQAPERAVPELPAYPYQHVDDGLGHGQGYGPQPARGQDMRYSPNF
ncbi:hypothetical protein GQ53DRAFT_849837 [Thozetella sp. PMI_491]|nr:hypothetical protein GQ53DRAFT_849837 [Thozetella sp. PMI_491]